MFPCSQALSQLMVSKNIELVSLHKRVRKLEEILLSNAVSSPIREVKEIDMPSEPSIRVAEPPYVLPNMPVFRTVSLTIHKAMG